jgi:integrase
VLLYRSGLRVSEACNACWRDITNCDLRVIGKGGKPRTVRLDDWTRTALEAWAQVRGNRKGYIFTKLAESDPINPVYVRVMLKRLKKKAGIEKRCNPHSLRHTFASEIAKEIPIGDVQDLLGHGSLVVTQRYVHQLNGNERALAAMAARK